GSACGRCAEIERLWFRRGNHGQDCKEKTPDSRGADPISKPQLFRREKDHLARRRSDSFSNPLVPFFRLITNFSGTASGLSGAADLPFPRDPEDFPIPRSRLSPPSGFEQSGCWPPKQSSLPFFGFPSPNAGDRFPDSG